MSKKAEGFSLRFVLINTGNISRKVLSKVLRSFDKNFERLHYHIIGERLIAYKYGKTSEVQVQNIEKSLNTIIEQFEEMKKDLVFLLSENENQQN